MAEKKQRLPRRALREGMFVAAAVKEPGGRLLIPSGVALTSRHLQALELWGVEAVCVGVADDTDADPVLTEGQLAAARDMLLPRFQYCDLTHPFAIALVKSCAKRLAMQARGT